MLAAASGTAYCQPNRIAAVTMNTEAIETSDFPLSSIGTGLRSAISASPKKIETVIAVAAEGGSSTVVASEKATSGSATTTVVVR